MAITTYKDLLDHVTDYFGADDTQEGNRYARRAVYNAIHEYGNLHNWTYYYTHGRLATVTPYATGTVGYTHTGGAVERMMTLTGGVWPAWAAFGSVLITQAPLGGDPSGQSTNGPISYDVAARVSDTVLQLSVNNNPGADIAAGKTFTVYRDTFPLPTDFGQADDFVLVGFSAVLVQMHPREWLNRQRLRLAPNTPRVYCVRGDPHYLGVQAVSFFPPPDNPYQVDFLYRRLPRQVRITDYTQGTVSIAANSTTLTGSGTNFTGNMVGSVIRLAADNVEEPTGPMGTSPYALERMILAVTDQQTLTVDNATATPLSGVKLSVSDPVDIQEGAMLSGLLRECERHARIVRRMQATATERAEYETSILRAMEADARSMARRIAGESDRSFRRFADMPRGPDS